MAQRIARISRQSSLLFLCDMQEKFRPTIKYFPQIVETSNKLLNVCKALDVPYVVTEQYPRGERRLSLVRLWTESNLWPGLGRTVSELEIGQVKPFEKTLFSMCTPDVVSHMKEKVKGTSQRCLCQSKTFVFLIWTTTNLCIDFNTAIICGIEAHVCVLQTTIDLLSQNYRVYIVADAVSSRSLTDRLVPFWQTFAAVNERYLECTHSITCDKPVPM